MAERGGEFFHLVAGLHCLGDNISEINLALAVFGADPVQGRKQKFLADQVNAGIYFLDCLLFGSGVFFFDNSSDIALFPDKDSAIIAWILKVVVMRVSMAARER